jgi:hypothetical protein
MKKRLDSTLGRLVMQNALFKSRKLLSSTRMMFSLTPNFSWVSWVLHSTRNRFNGLPGKPQNC